jgi:hypothetical protein
MKPDAALAAVLSGDNESIHFIFQLVLPVDFIEQLLDDRNT